MNEANNPWGGGNLGAVLRDELVASESFRRVYCPSEPQPPPPLRLAVDAVGSLDGHDEWENFASTLTAAFLMLPSAFMPFFKDFELRCTVTLEEEGQRLHRFEVAGQRRVTHALFAKRESYLQRAREELYREVAHLVASELETIEATQARNAGDSARRQGLAAALPSARKLSIPADVAPGPGSR